MDHTVLIIGQVSDEAVNLVSTIIGVPFVNVQHEESRSALKANLKAGVLYDFTILITTKDLSGGDLNRVRQQVNATCAISISTNSHVHHVEARDNCAAIRLTEADMQDEHTSRKVTERLAYYAEGTMSAWPAEFVGETLAGTGHR